MVLVEHLKGQTRRLREELLAREQQVVQLEKQLPQFESDSMLHVSVVDVRDSQAIAVRINAQADLLQQMLQAATQELAKEASNRQELARLNAVRPY